MKKRPKSKHRISGWDNKKEVICKTCKTKFLGGPNSKYCFDCKPIK